MTFHNKKFPIPQANIPSKTIFGIVPDCDTNVSQKVHLGTIKSEEFVSPLIVTGHVVYLETIPSAEAFGIIRVELE